jgi:hypothetical protein
MRILDASGNTLKTLRTYSNQEVDRLLWTRDTFDVSTLKGQSIRLRADWSETATNLTAWRLDDLALTFDTGAGAPVVGVISPDLNGDSAVGPLDLLTFAKYYGTANASCLFSGDSIVSDDDLALLLASM